MTDSGNLETLWTLRIRELFTAHSYNQIDAEDDVQEMKNFFQRKATELQLIEHEYKTRGKRLNATIPKCGKTVGQGSSTFVSGKLFDSLLIQLREIKNSKVFISRMTYRLRSMEMSRVNDQ